MEFVITSVRRISGTRFKPRSSQSLTRGHAHVFDSWIVGNSPDSGRTYVIHAVAPRFIVEILDFLDGARKFGALEWIDDPGLTDAARWSGEASEIYERSRRPG